MEEHRIQVSVNGDRSEHSIEARLLLSDFLRHRLHLTGTHLGCEHGVCGACTVLIDGSIARSCLTFAVQIDGREITTIEGIGQPAGAHPVQMAFRTEQALQCGYCTPAMVLTAVDLLARNPKPNDDEIREAISGNLCRCTGYQSIIAAVRRAANSSRSE